MSLSDVESIIGLPTEYLNQLEQDRVKKRPEPKILSQLASVYEIDYEQLLADAGYFIRRRKPVLSLANKVAAWTKLCEAEWFNAEARSVRTFARENAIRRGVRQHNTTDILYGLINTPTIFKNLRVELEKIRVPSQLCTDFSGPADASQTVACKNVFVFALKEATSSKQNFIHGEHLVFGLLADEQTNAARILRNAGLSIENVRASIARKLSE